MLPNKLPKGSFIRYKNAFAYSLLISCGTCGFSSKGVDHYTRVMATVSPSCAHKKAACLRCNSGICSSCCKCFKPKGRPKKRTTQEIVQLRRNTSRAVRPKSFVEPPSEFLEQEPVVSETFEVASRCNL